MPKNRPRNPIDVHVGAQIGLRRKALQLSQGELGKQLGVTFQQVQKYEDGRNRVAAGRLFQIAQYLGVPISHFYEGLTSGGGGDTKEAAGAETQRKIAAFIATPEGNRLCTAFVRVPSPDKRKRVIDLVTSLLAAE